MVSYKLKKQVGAKADLQPKKEKKVEQQKD